MMLKCSLQNSGAGRPSDVEMLPLELWMSCSTSFLEMALHHGIVENAIFFVQYVRIYNCNIDNVKILQIHMYLMLEICHQKL